MSEVTTIQVGQIVPDFTMETYLPTKKDFGSFSLAEAKKAGKWTVLVFYPADFTFVCATEFAALADQYAALQKLGAEVLTVSTDTKFTHLAWQKHEGELASVTYPMAADRTGAVATTSEEASTTLKDREVVQCVVRAFQYLSFPTPEGGIASTTYVLDFAP